MFRRASLLFVVACLAGVGAARGAGNPAGSLSVAPSFVVVPPGMLGTTTLTWSTSGCSTAEIHVSVDGGPGALYADSPSGTGGATWIVPDRTYEFRLTAEHDQSVLLDRAVVRTIAPGGGRVVAEPATVSVAAGQLGTAVLSWATDGRPGAEVWVRHEGQEQLFARSASGQAAATWIVAGHTYDFDLYDGPRPSSVLSTVRVVGVAGGAVAPVATPAYTIGVDFHSTTADFGPAAFVARYDVPAVRAAVQQQLQGMADRGARFLSTRLWMVSANPASDQPWQWHFPPSAQEVANLRAYAQDVANVRAADGHALTLDICTLWLWAADYQYGSPSTTLGREGLSAAEFTKRVETTLGTILDAVKDVRRPDGKQVVETFYMDGEVMIGAKPNEDWFLKTHYPSFVQRVSTTGITPSIYFLTVADEDEVLDDGFTDGTYPDLNGHRSMFWVYRSLRFMKDAGLPLPARMDASTYVSPKTASYDVLVKRIFDDADAALGPLGVRSRYGIAETFYFPDADAAKRKALGRALATEAAQRRRLERTSFWTTPDAGGPGVASGYPFAIEDYLP